MADIDAVTAELEQVLDRLRPHDKLMETR